MLTAQPFAIRATAARTIADLRGDCASLFLGYRAEVEERLALAQHDDDPARAERVISDLERRIQAQADRIAAEDAAFRRAPLYCRRTEAGHRCLLVERDGVEMFVPLVELNDAELGLIAA